jgi:hypothetical protein
MKRRKTLQLTPPFRTATFAVSISEIMNFAGCRKVGHPLALSFL